MFLSTSGEPSRLPVAARPLAPRDTLSDQLLRAEMTRRLMGSTVEPITVGRYEVLGALGCGGMGAVYRAYDPHLRRHVALKVLRSDHSADIHSSQRLAREAAALARLNHPNVVSLYEAGRHGDDVYLAMEMVHGLDLEAWARQHTNPASGPSKAHLRTAIGILCQAARGLAAAHDAGVVHRDFKPSNVLVGNDGRVRVADFGLALTTDLAGTDVRSGLPIPRRSLPLVSVGWSLDREPRATATAGTPRYMAPEQLCGAGADALSDQFSFCVVAWEILRGCHPRPGEPPSTPRPAVKIRGIMSYLRRGLSLDPRGRHTSMHDLLEVLEDAGSVFGTRHSNAR